MSEFTLEPLYDYPQREQVLALARTHADAVDRGERSPFENLREIAKDGLITLGRDGGSLVPQVSVAFDLATEDASTAFSLWAHRSTIAFFDARASPPRRSGGCDRQRHHRHGGSVQGGFGSGTDQGGGYPH